MRKDLYNLLLHTHKTTICPQTHSQISTFMTLLTPIWTPPTRRWWHTRKPTRPHTLTLSTTLQALSLWNYIFQDTREPKILEQDVRAAPSRTSIKFQRPQAGSTIMTLCYKGPAACLRNIATSSSKRWYLRKRIQSMTIFPSNLILLCHTPKTAHRTNFLRQERTTPTTHPLLQSTLPAEGHQQRWLG